MCFLFEKVDLEKATTILFNHRKERFVKQVLVHLLEEYAKTTDNDIDDKFVNMFREKLNVENEVRFRFSGYEDK
jgi:DNA-binding response OmpR family regulator